MESSMSRKNFLFLFLLPVVAGGILVGCSMNDSSDPGSPAAGVATRDKITCAQIQNLSVDRSGNDITVTFDTPCTAIGAVAWGYAPDALDNPILGGGTTHHVFNFSVAGNEGCVYLQATAVETGYPGSSDMSEVLTSVKDVVISNVNRSIDALACTMTVTWTTNVKSSSKLYWGNNCSSLTNTGTGAGNATSHAVTVDISGVRANSRIYSKPESETGCDSAQGGCAFAFKYYCIN